MIKFGVLIEFDKFSSKSQRIHKDDSTGEPRRHFLFQAPAPLEISGFYFWTDLVAILLRERILGADSKSEALEATITPILAILCNFTSRMAEKQQTLLNITAAVATDQATEKQN